MFTLRRGLKLLFNLTSRPGMCGQQNRKMTVQDTIEELTRTGMQLRRDIESTSDPAEKARLVLKHIKCFSSDSNRVNDFQKGLEWFNVSERLSLHQHLNGKIVLMDFFTYCCINCMHILPDLEALEQKFTPEDGLVVIGVHSAKFANERNSDKILSAIQRYNINHPVVNDARLSMWRDIGISCWPSLVILGPKAQPLFVMVGEGHREEMFLYVKVCLEYFKSTNEISDHSLPLKSARHLLPATKDTLLFPGKVQVFTWQNEEKLIVSDTGNNRILIMNVDGKVDFVIGGYAPGSKDGSFEDARFNAPQGTCFYDDCIYVADNENHAIRKIDLKTKRVKTVAGVGTQGHDYTGGKFGTNQALSSPWDVAVYLHKQNDKVVPVIIIAIAGTHQLWAYFIEDTTWWKNKQYKSGTCSVIVGNGREENRNNSYPHAASLAQPSGLAISEEFNYLFFADSESSSIRKVHMDDGKVTPVCGADKNPSNLHDFGDVDGKQYSAKLQHPLGVAWDPSRKLIYIADTYNHKIKQSEIDGNCTTLYGAGKPNNDFNFDEPAGLAVSKDCEILFVADTNNHSLKAIDLKNKSLRQISVELPPEANIKSDKNYSFNTAINSKGGNLYISFDVLFQDASTKLNSDAPQKWALQSLPTQVTAANLKGDIKSPISLIIHQGEEPISLSVTLDLVTCRVDECKPIKLSADFIVNRKHDAPDNLSIKEELKVK